MSDKKQQGKAPAKPAMVRPSWADPRFVLASNRTRITLVSFTGAGIKQILDNAPVRWAFGVLSPVPASFVFGVSPDPDPQNFGFVGANTPQGIWYTAFEFGPLLMQEWFMYSSGVSSVKIVEVLTQ